MKRTISVLLLLLLLLSLFPATAFAAEENDISHFEFPTPKAPNYFIYTDGDASEGHHDNLRMIMVTDPEVALLAAEYPFVSSWYIFMSSATHSVSVLSLPQKP